MSELSSKPPLDENDSDERCYKTPLPTKVPDAWLLSPPQLKALNSVPLFPQSSTSSCSRDNIYDQGNSSNSALENDLHFPVISNAFERDASDTRSSQLSFRRQRRSMQRRRATSFDASLPVPQVTLKPRFAHFPSDRTNSEIPDMRMPPRYIPQAVNSMYHQEDSDSCACLDCILAKLPPTQAKPLKEEHGKQHEQERNRSSPDRSHVRSHTYDGGDVFAAAISAENENVGLRSPSSVWIPRYRPNHMNGNNVVPEIARPIARHQTSNTTSFPFFHNKDNYTSSVNQKECPSSPQEMGDTICSSSASAFDVASPKSRESDDTSVESLAGCFILKEDKGNQDVAPTLPPPSDYDKGANFPFDEVQMQVPRRPLPMGEVHFMEEISSSFANIDMNDEDAITSLEECDQQQQSQVPPSKNSSSSSIVNDETSS